MAEKSIEEVKEKVTKGLECARFKLLERFPFTGEMVLRFSIVPTYDCRCNTAATDGTRIFFDCEFYSTLTESQREFVLAHEVWHNIFLHFMRQGTRDHQLWNIATDMEINHMLKNDGFDVLEDACMPDPIVAGKSAEEIYEYLKQEQEKQPKSNDGDGNGKGNGSDSNEDDSNSNAKNSGNNKSKHGNQFDKHIYEGEIAGTGDKKDGKWGEKGFDNDFTPSMKNAKETADKVKEMVCSAAQSVERKHGHLPAGIDHIIQEMLKPEINWKEALSMFYTNVMSGDHSWKRCSRHALGRGMYLQGRNSEKIKTLVCVDTSGSCLSDIPKFLAELDSLARSFGNYEITLLQCDAEVQKVEYFDESNPITVKNFKAKGFGGTSFKPPFRWLRENGESDYSCVIYLTDGYGDAPNYPPSIPTLWVLTSDGCDNFCDWGQKMRFKPNSDYR